MPVELPRHDRPAKTTKAESILDTIQILEAAQVDMMAVRMAVLDRVSRSLAI